MFGWDEYWDHRENFPNYYAAELLRSMTSSRFVSTLPEAKRSNENDKKCGGSGGKPGDGTPGGSGGSAGGGSGDDASSGSYFDKDWSRGGGMVGSKWLPYCGCARVGYKTTFTSGFECASAWESSGTCQAVRASSALSSITKRKPVKTSPMSDGKRQQQEKKLRAKATRAPVYVAFNLTNSTLVGDKCEALRKVHRACKETLCNMLSNAFSILGYANRSLDCNRSQFTFKMFKKRQKKEKSPKALREDVYGLCKKANGKRRMATEAELHLNVYSRIDVGFPDVVPKDDNELARLEADQTSVANLVKQQWDVLAANNLLQDTLSTEDPSIGYFNSVEAAPATSEPSEECE